MDPKTRSQPMGKTDLKHYSSAGLEDLNDKQFRFVQSYMIDLDGQKAAIDAGYSPKSARTQAAKLLSSTKIAKAIGVLKRRGMEKAELTLQEVMVHLKHCVVRTSDDFLDEDGRLKPHSEWNERAKAALDGIKQRRRVIKSGEEIIGEEIETEIKLVSKGGAITTAMRHFENRVDPEELKDKKLDWDALYDEKEDSASTELKKLESND